MGTIIAYDVLRTMRQRHPDFGVVQFVTIGSPLGLPLVKAKVLSEYASHEGEAVRTPTVFEAGLVTLPPGRYRVYLLADATAEIRLPLTTGRGLTVRTTMPVKETFSVANAAVDSGRTSLALRHPVGATTRTRTFVIGQYGPGAFTTDLRLTVCLARRKKACGAHNGVTTTGATMTTTQAGLGDSSWLPDRTPRDARVEAVLSPDAKAAWLSLAVVQYDRV